MASARLTESSSPLVPDVATANGRGNTKTSAPNADGAQATVGGVSPSTETLMKGNDQPQMKARSRRRRISRQRGTRPAADCAERAPASLRCRAEPKAQRAMDTVNH